MTISKTKNTASLTSFEIDVISQAHFRSNCLENKSFLSSVRMWEFDLSIQSTRSKKRRIEGILSVGGHDNLDVCGLIETVHLIQQLDQNSLHFSISTCLRIKPPRKIKSSLL